MEHVSHSAATGSYLSQRLPWILLLLVLAALAVRAWLPKIGPLGDPDAQPRPITPRGDLAADEPTTLMLQQWTANQALLPRAGAQQTR